MKSFEERLPCLEKISQDIQGGIPLAEVVTLFEEGITLSKGLEKELARIERKIKILSLTEFTEGLGKPGAQRRS